MDEWLSVWAAQSLSNPALQYLSEVELFYTHLMRSQWPYAWPDVYYPESNAQYESSNESCVEREQWNQYQLYLQSTEQQSHYEQDLQQERITSSWKYFQGDLCNRINQDPTSYLKPTVSELWNSRTQSQLVGYQVSFIEVWLEKASSM